MTAPHSDPAVAELRAIRSGPGGRVLVVVGGETPGLDRYPVPAGGVPVGSLFEAVLAYIGDEGGYARIVAFTGAGPHLPAGWVVGTTGLAVGRAGGVWLVRGDPPAPPPPPPAGELSDDEEIRQALRANRQVMSGAGYVFTSYGRQSDWFEQITSVLHLLETETGIVWTDRTSRPAPGRGDRPRTLVILDEAVLIPEGEQVLAPDQVNRATRRDIVERLQTIPRLIAGSRSDLILLARSPATPAALLRGTMIHDQWLAEWNRRHPGQGTAAAREDRLPMVGWPDVPSVTLAAVDHGRPFGPYWPSAADAHTRYQTLRRVVPQPPLARGLRRPADPTTPDLEVWANLDVEGLERVFQEHVIGQEDITRKVIASLSRFQKTCRRAVRKGLKQLPQEAGEKPDANHRPPVFFFLGESGMGKTHIAELISYHLFKRKVFKVTLTNRPVATEVFGVGGEWVSGEVPRPFMKQCMDTGGLGVVLFDELDKVRVEQHQTFSDAVNAFYEPLEEWSVRPLNPVHHNCTDGQLHFANTILVFAGNFTRDDEEDRPGYKHLRQLGEPLLGRFTDFLRFNELDTKDIPRAVEFFLRRHARGAAKSAFVRGNVDVDVSGVVHQLAEEFEALTRGARRQRNFRVLSRRFLPNRIPLDDLLDKIDAGDLTIRPADLRNRGQSLDGD